MKVEPSVAGVADEPRAVLLIYTGGTIGMARSPRGYAPVPGLLAELLRARPDFQDRDRPPGVTPPTRHGRRIRYDILEYAPLVDSSNMGMGDWAQIARDIGRRYDAYDAFVVLHGTDTMAYTASALSFMLANLGKSVIVTGSMIPLTEVRSDGADNLLSALILAGHYELPEVGLYFHRQLLRGNRTRKVDAAGLGAFASANFPPLATVGVDIEVAWERVRAASGE
ncbi:MAG: asparaginase, partial [Myxococcales bacterium]|nr:asparaginase [Myxococcales bacterium]